VILKHFRFVDLRPSLVRPATEIVSASCYYPYAGRSSACLAIAADSPCLLGSA
jgi:hypothetical protein